MVLANFANQTHEDYTIGLPGPGRWQVRFNSDWQGYDGEFSDFDSFGTEAEEGEYDGYAWHGSIGMAPYAVLILSQRSVTKLLAQQARTSGRVARPDVLAF